MHERFAVLGVGDDRHGDDAVGPIVARALEGLSDACLAIDAGVCPEAYTGVLRRFRPELVLFVDAADMGLTPGEVVWLADWHSNEVSAATHGLPLRILADYLRTELGCRVVLIGIQPETVDFGSTEVSPRVRAAAAHVIDTVRTYGTNTRERRNSHANGPKHHAH